MRITGAGDEAHPAASERRHRPQVLARMTGGAHGELLRGRVRRIPRVRREVHVDEDCEEGSRRCARAIDLVERPLQHVHRQRGIAASEVDGGERAGCGRVGIEPLEQLLRFLEPPLPDAEIREPNECSAAQNRAAQVPAPDGVGECGISLGPATGCREDPAVMRAAERRHGGKVPTLRDRVTDAHPLVGPGDVVCVLARREQLAEDLFHDVEVVDLAARYGREGLVEEHHALFGPVVVDEARPEVRERHELQVAVIEAASRLERFAERLLLPGPVALEHAEVERHPSRLGGVARVREERLRPCDPPAHDRGVADHRAVRVRERPRHPDRATLVPGLAVGRVGALPVLDRTSEVALEIRRARHALDHLARGRLGEGTFEGPPGRGAVADPKRGATLLDQV